jgi:uncharacterized LabA/DUF88 family protein
MPKEANTNLAFIDGQNLHLGTSNHEDGGWHIDYRKFRTYLSDKYGVSEAYYYMGCVREKEQELYTNLQLAGFVLNFREHTDMMKAKKKGNVDSDIIFDIMKRVADNSLVGKVVLVSGDGDYKKMANYLLKRGKLEHILFPNRKYASSLYDILGSDHFSSLDEPDVRRKIEYFKMKKAP